MTNCSVAVTNNYQHLLIVQHEMEFVRTECNVLESCSQTIIIRTVSSFDEEQIQFISDRSFAFVESFLPTKSTSLNLNRLGLCLHPNSVHQKRRGNL